MKLQDPKLLFLISELNEIYPGDYYPYELRDDNANLFISEPVEKDKKYEITICTSDNGSVLILELILLMKNGKLYDENDLIDIRNIKGSSILLMDKYNNYSSDKWNNFKSVFSNISQYIDYDDYDDY